MDLVVPRRPGVGQRLIDAVIIEDGDHRVASRAESASLNLNGHDIVVVQTKAARLGMYLLGQALFSRELIKDRFAPKSVRTVALCAIDDAVLRPLAERFGVEVVVDDLAGHRLREPPLADSATRQKPEGKTPIPILHWQRWSPMQTTVPLGHVAAHLRMIEVLCQRCDRRGRLSTARHRRAAWRPWPADWRRRLDWHYRITFRRQTRLRNSDETSPGASRPHADGQSC